LANGFASFFAVKLSGETAPKAKYPTSCVAGSVFLIGTVFFSLMSATQKAISFGEVLQLVPLQELSMQKIISNNFFEPKPEQYSSPIEPAAATEQNSQSYHYQGSSPKMSAKGFFPKW
jgi:hypothetical protein